MKRFLVIALAIVMVFSLAACNGTSGLEKVVGEMRSATNYSCSVTIDATGDKDDVAALIKLYNLEDLVELVNSESGLAVAVSNLDSSDEVFALTIEGLDMLISGGYAYINANSIYDGIGNKYVQASLEELYLKRTDAVAVAEIIKSFADVVDHGLSRSNAKMEHDGNYYAISYFENGFDNKTEVVVRNNSVDVSHTYSGSSVSLTLKAMIEYDADIQLPASEDIVSDVEDLFEELPAVG